ncbi:hypothetical protein GCM10027047_10330 [Rhodococcus aerolatus]
MTVRLLDRTVTAAEAAVLATWVYPPPWDHYSHDRVDPAVFLRRGGGEGYHPPVDDDGTLVGFSVLGAEARIPAQAAEPGTVDLGIGVRPDLTGRGVGTALLARGVELARTRPGSRRVRVVVATDNARSLALCRRADLAPLRELEGPGGRRFVELAAGLSPPAGR